VKSPRLLIAVIIAASVHSKALAASPAQWITSFATDNTAQLLTLFIAAASAVGVLATLLGRRSAREAQALREALSRTRAQLDQMAARPEPNESSSTQSDSTTDEATAQLDVAAPDQPRPSPPRIPQGLADAIVHGTAILVVGGGASVRQQAPSWNDFLGSVASGDSGTGSELIAGAPDPVSRLARLLERGEVDAAVDVLEQKIGRDALASRARDAFAAAVPSPGFERLCRLQWSGFIATTIDDSVERAVGAANVVTVRSGMDFEQLVRTDKQFLLKLGGTLSEPQTLILTRAQLKQTLTEAPDLRSLLSSFFTARPILFVGLPFLELERLWDSVGMFGPSSSAHYALIEPDPDFDLLAERARSKYNIELLEVGTPGELADFADRLAVKVEERVRSLRHAPRELNVTRNFISAVKLVNIGPFSEATLPIASEWTVILGNNGAGKSTLLRAIALVLAGTAAEARPYARSLLKRGTKSGSVELTIDTLPQPVTYRAQLSLEGDRVNVTAAVSPLQAGAILAFGFSAVRGISDLGTAESETLPDQRLPRVSDILPLLRGGADGRAQDLRTWIRQNYSIQQDSSLPVQDRERARSRLDTLFSIVDQMAPGFDLRFSRCHPTTGEILLSTSDGEIPLEYVSQGMSSMIGWTGTLIQRLFEIQGDDDNPADAHAILLIDEIDSHLHPEWQQRLVPTLRNSFANLQVIATTHSALMVGSLGQQEVVKVSRDSQGLHVDLLDKSFKGYRVDQILTDPAFDLASARDLDWEALRAEYAVLLGKDDRTADEDDRYMELDALMDSAPPPFEAHAQREAYELSRQRVDAVIEASSADRRPAPGEAGGAG
jgi:energy-coupling factor transporter ATP-binding protein EcfA2